MLKIGFVQVGTGPLIYKDGVNVGIMGNNGNTGGNPGNNNGGMFTMTH